MSAINRLSISGFRGILQRLDLNFVRNGKPNSMIVYGANGTGKSSITDAWEYIQTGSIEHLRKEGAMQDAYPHKMAKPKDTFVELESDDNLLGSLRLEYDHTRRTTPIQKGNIKKFRDIITHPCQLRYGDLTKFVYYTKSERYDELTKLMGVAPQVEYQKALKRVARKLEENINNKNNIYESNKGRLKNKLQIEKIDEDTFIKIIIKLYKDVDIESDENIESIRLSLNELTNRVEEDQKTKELSQLTNIKSDMQKIELGGRLLTNYDEYKSNLKSFKDEADQQSKNLLVDLYKTGIEVLKIREDKRVCPLCGNKYEGDLLDHLCIKHENLLVLQQSYNQMEECRIKIKEDIDKVISPADSMKNINNKYDLELLSMSLENIIEKSNRIDDLITNAKSLVNIESLNVDENIITKIRENQSDLNGVISEFNTMISNLINDISKNIVELKNDTTRSKLVESHTLIRAALDIWDELTESERNVNSLSKTYKTYNLLVNKYIEDSTNDVENKFATISNNVERYFSIVEKHTSDIAHPSLKLTRDKERSVILEIEFLGERISPAYKYLSESQLHSFGLAVFLASVKQFNKEFKFLILDDIINSFDFYKRPQVLELLKTEFADYQILLLTHDQYWKDIIYRKFPNWQKIEFCGYSAITGPQYRMGKGSIERIEELIEQDRPREAGSLLGPYLEQQLQSLCENFEVMVKYNRRNEYTLDPLFVYLMTRVKDKIGQQHVLYTDLNKCWQNDVFRNYCSHWKSSDFVITKEELSDILELWENVELLVYCQDASCKSPLFWVKDKGAFICNCGKSVIKKDI